MTAIIHTIDALHDIASEADFIAKAVVATGQDNPAAGLSFIIARWAETLDALGNVLQDEVDSTQGRRPDPPGQSAHTLN